MKASEMHLKVVITERFIVLDAIIKKKKTWKINFSWLFYLGKLEKQQITPKESRRNELIKMKAEIKLIGKRIIKST